MALNAPSASPIASPDGIPLCASPQLQDGGDAVPFDVSYGGQTCRAFAIRWRGQPHAYLNRCSHVAMELDWQPNRFFDDTGQWLLCSSHGAAYQPDTGACGGGPCKGGLVKIPLVERAGVVAWLAQAPLAPLDF